MNLIAHVEIPVRQLERAMAFYRALFNIDFDGIQALHGSRMAYFPFQAGEDGASGALAEGPPYIPGQHGAIIYFSVADIAATLEHALALGAECLFPITEAGDGLRVAEIRDSEGNRIALQQLG